MNNLMKETYDKVLKSGMFWEFYPQLTGVWEEDKEFWEEEYLERLEKWKDEN